MPLYIYIQYQFFLTIIYDFSKTISPEEGPVIEELKEQTPPVFHLGPEAVKTAEGEAAKFLVKVGGYPRPRVTWWINGSQISGVSNKGASNVWAALLLIALVI